MYKICSKCRQEKLFSEFHKSQSGKFGYTNQCKTCLKEYRRINKDRISAERRQKYSLKTKLAISQPAVKNYYELNKDKIADYYQANKDKIADYRREYKKANRAKLNALDSKRRAIKLKSTPKWLTEADYRAIEDFYKIAQKLKLETGQEYHVDHIVPLQGKDVCGLHVPWNLQVISASENLRKSNKLLQ